MTDHVHVSEADGLLTIVFNRPEAMNALRPEMLEAARNAIAKAPPSVRVAVIEGAGRAFSAGVDLKVLQGISPVAGKIGDAFDEPSYKFGRAIRKAPFPVIAKVHGACFTGALELALYCDMVYTTADAKFGDTHAKFGIRPTWGMTQNLPRAVGIRMARELSFTARTFSGEEAARLGIANAAVADKAALDALVAETCAAIIANSQAAVAAIKDLYRLHEELLPLEQSLEEECVREYPDIRDTDERLAAFRK